ncbi:DUF11 domain-containing protein [Conexibacter woesei]|uniref:DUF11 domain-containing protein n=1 Tax=Conexibacter woesei TaxID=191495 RepID=UPI00135F18C1|nr:DUF11 domain-containing protein [Conexibacter woesei]
MLGPIRSWNVKLIAIAVVLASLFAIGLAAPAAHAAPPDPPTIQVDSPTTITGGGTIAVSGTAVADAPIAVFVNNTARTGTYADSNGAWSATVSAEDGDNYVSAVQTVSGETSAPSSAVYVANLATPRVFTPAANATVGTTFTVVGDHNHPGATVEVRDENGALLGSNASGDWNWSLTTTVALPAGPHTLSVTVTREGVVGPARTRAITVADGGTPVAPDPPTVATPVSSGVVAGPVRFSGTAEPGARVDVSNPVLPIVHGSGTADQNGAFDFTVDLAPGSHSVAVTQEVGGLTSDATTVWFTVLPAPPAFGTLPAAAATGSQVTASGTAEPNANITLTRNSTVAATTQADANGNWNTPVTIDYWDNYLTVTQELNGEVSDAAPEQHVIGVSPPSLSTPAADSVVDQTFAISGGDAVPDATITILDEDDRVLATTTAVSLTLWSTTTTVPLGAGARTITVRVSYGGVSAETDHAVVVRPPVPSLARPATGESADDAGHVRFTGTALPNAGVNVFLSGVQDAVGGGTADASGAFDFTAALAPGRRRIRVGQLVAGQPSPRSAIVQVAVRPGAPELTHGARTVVADAEATVGGSAVAGATVELRDAAGATVAEATAAGDGAWSAAVEVAAGRHPLTAVQSVDAVAGSASAAFALTGVGAPAVTAPAPGALVDPVFAVAGSALPGATVTLRDAGGRTRGSTVAGDDGAWSLTTTSALAAGERTLSLVQTLDGVSGPAATRRVTIRQSGSGPGGQPDTDGPSGPGASPSARAALALTARTSRTSARAGQAIRYRLTVANTGTTAVRGALACATLPRGTRLLADGGGRRARGARLCWTLPELRPGSRRTLSFAVRATRRTARPRSTVTLTAPGLPTLRTRTPR